MLIVSDHDTIRGTAYVIYSTPNDVYLMTARHVLTEVVAAERKGAVSMLKVYGGDHPWCFPFDLIYPSCADIVEAGLSISDDFGIIRIAQPIAWAQPVYSLFAFPAGFDPRNKVAVTFGPLQGSSSSITPVRLNFSGKAPHRRDGGVCYELLPENPDQREMERWKGMSGAPVFLTSNEWKNTSVGLLSITSYFSDEPRAYCLAFDNIWHKMPSAHTPFFTGGYCPRSSHITAQTMQYMAHVDAEHRLAEKTVNLCPDLLPALKLQIREKDDPTCITDVESILRKTQSPNMDRKHYFLLGPDGGSGKTTALLNSITALREDVRLLPMYIPLQEYNSFYRRKRKGGFLHQYIMNNFVDASGKKTPVHGFTAFLRKEYPDCPHVVLALDGFNEVTVDTAALVEEIIHYMNMPGCSVVICSRYDMREHFAFQPDDFLPKFQLYELLPLSNDTVRHFLQDRGIDAQDIPYAVLANPMRLIIYAQTQSLQKASTWAPDEALFDPVTSKGTLLWNYFAYMQAGAGSADPDWEQAQWRHTFTEIAPTVAFAMAYQEKYELLSGELDELLKPYATFGNAQTIRANLLSQGLLVEQRRGSAKLHSFLHQDFRDFFAGKALYHETQQFLSSQMMPAYKLNLTAIPYPALSYAGDVACAKSGQQPLPMHRALARMKTGKKLPQGLNRAAFTNNLVLMIAYSQNPQHPSVAGWSLDHLDLRETRLNGIDCSDSGERPASFSHSLFSQNTFLPESHFESINAIDFRIIDGVECLLTASYDGDVIEWDWKAQRIMQRYHAHKEQTLRVRYIGDCSHAEGVSFLTSSRDGTLKRWYRGKTEGEMLIRHKKRITDFCISQDGRFVYTVSRDCNIGRIDLSGQNAPFFFPEGHSTAVLSVAVSSSGDDLFTCSAPSKSAHGEIIHWRSSDGCLMDRYTFGDNHACCLALWEDGPEKHLYAGMKSGHVCSFSATLEDKKILSGKHNASPRGDNAINALAFNVDPESCDSNLYSCSRDYTVGIWDTSSGKNLRFCHHADSDSYIPEHIDNVVGLIPWRQRLFTCSWDITVKEWSLVSYRPVRSLTCASSSVLRLCFSPDGEKLLYTSWADRSVYEINTAAPYDRAFIQKHQLGPSGLLYADGGKAIVSGAYDNLALVYHKETQTQSAFDAHPACVHSFATHVSQPNIIFSGDEHDKGNEILKWTLDRREVLSKYPRHQKAVSALSVSSDGRYLLASSWDPGFSISKIDDPTIYAVFPSLREDGKKTDDVTSAVFSPDERKVLTSTRDGYVIEYALSDDYQMLLDTRYLYKNDDLICRAYYHPLNPNTVVFASFDGMLRLVDTLSLNLLNQYEVNPNRRITDFAVHQNNHLFAISSNTGIIRTGHFTSEALEFDTVFYHCNGIMVEKCPMTGIQFQNNEHNADFDIYRAILHQHGAYLEQEL